MKKLFYKHRMTIVITILLLTTTLLLNANYNLFPFERWTSQLISQTPVRITATPINIVNKPVTITRAGSIEASTSVPINADFSGHISELYVTEGQAVKAGQPLLKLKASSNQTVSQSTEVSQQVQADYDNALKEFNRYQKLYEIGGIPRRQLEMATTHLQEAKANLTNAQNTMQSSAVTVNGFATMTAPIDGIVMSLSTAPEKAVQAGQQLLSLGSGQEVEVVIPLGQNDLYLIHLGTPTTLEILHQTFAGQVSRIYPQVEANQSPSFLAHIKLTNNPAGLLKPGMSGNVHINIGQSATVAAVPTASVLHDGQGRSFIYTAINGKAILQQVSIGETIDDFTEITSDLPQNSMVVTSSINDIKNGDQITIIQ